MVPLRDRLTLRAPDLTIQFVGSGTWTDGGDYPYSGTYPSTEPEPTSAIAGTSIPSWVDQRRGELEGEDVLLRPRLRLPLGERLRQRQRRGVPRPAEGADPPPLARLLVPDRPGRRRDGPHARRPARLHDVRRRVRRPRPAPLRREGAAGRDRDRRRVPDAEGPLRRPVHAVPRQQADDGVPLGGLVDEPDPRLRQDRPGRRPVPPAPPRLDLRRRARGRRPRPRGDARPRRLEPDGDEHAGSSRRARGSQGTGAFWTTDLSLRNAGTAAATATVKFLGHSGDGRGGAETPVTLAAGETRTWGDVLSTLFGLSADWGPILVRSESSGLVVLGQTSTPGGGGTFGQSVPAFAPGRPRRGDPALDPRRPAGRLVPDEPHARQRHETRRSTSTSPS